MSAMFCATRILKRAARLLPAALEVAALLPPARLGWAGSPLVRLRLGAAGGGLLGLRLDARVAMMTLEQGSNWLDAHAQQARAAAIRYRRWQLLPATTCLYWSETQCASHALLLDAEQSALWLAWQGTDRQETCA